MSTTLDPMRLRLLLQNLRSEFPGVDYATLVRTVMEAESLQDIHETWEDYTARIWQALEKENAVHASDCIRRSGRIYRQRPCLAAELG